MISLTDDRPRVIPFILNLIQFVGLSRNEKSVESSALTENLQKLYLSPDKQESSHYRRGSKCYEDFVLTVLENRFIISFRKSFDKSCICISIHQFENMFLGMNQTIPIWWIFRQTINCLMMNGGINIYFLC